MLDAAIKTQLQGYLERIVHPIQLVASLDDSEKSQEMLALLEDVAAQSPKITLVTRRDRRAQAVLRHPARGHRRRRGLRRPADGP